MGALNVSAPGGEKEGKYARKEGGGERGVFGSGEGGEGGEEEQEGWMRTRALREHRASEGQARTEGRVQAQRGLPRRLERLGDQHRGGVDTIVGHIGQFRRIKKEGAGGGGGGAYPFVACLSHF